jgi:outer membrane protein TolC
MAHRLLVLAIVVELSLPAQVVTSLTPYSPSFPSSQYFKQQWRRPPLEVELNPPLRLEDYVASGKLELSLRSYIELVMANNTDVALQRLTVYTFKNAIERAFAPFDPAFIGSFNTSRSNTPSNDLLAGATVLSNLSQRANFNYIQTLETGTQYQVGFLGLKSANNSAFTNFNPSIQSNLQVQITQPLLRNRGAYINRIPILIARSRLRAGEADMRERITTLLSQAENAYWDVIDAREALVVRQKSLELADAFLKRSRRELELGAISPLEIFQPEQQFATAQVGVTLAEYRLKQREDALRKWIGADLHPTIRKLPLVLTETVMADTESVLLIDTDEAIEKALRLRPEIESSRFNTDVADLQITSATNRLRPDLSLTGNYTSQGRGGNFFQRTFAGAAGVGSTPTSITVIPGGLSDALNQLFYFNYPVYGFSLNLRLPLRDRAAAADLADAALSKKQQMLSLRNLEQRIRLEVLNALSGVEQSRAGIKQATVARHFAQERLNAEQKRYELGVSQIFLVLQAQTDLTTAESELLTQSIAYRRNVIALLQVTGDLLNERGVVIQ